MKRSPLLNPSSLINRSFWSYCAVFLVVAGFGANALAGTPIWVNVYQSMEQGNNGDLLTNATMNATSYGTQGWSASPGPMWVSTNYHTDLPNPINCGGTVYNGTGGSRSWMFNNNNENCYVQCGFSGHSNLTIACYYTTLSTNPGGYDVMVFASSWMQTLGWADDLLLPAVYPSLSGPNLRQETSTPNGVTGTTQSLWITPGHTYWVNMKYDGAAGVILLAVFDPANNYAQVGPTAFSPSTPGMSPGSVQYGRQDEHGNFNDPTQAYFDQIMYDWTNAAFPLLPSGYNDVTPPSAAERSRWRRLYWPQRLSGDRPGKHGTDDGHVVDAIVGQLGPGLGRRERNQRLPVLHRHHLRRNEHRQLDHDSQPAGGNEDGLEPELGHNLLFHRQGH